MKKILYKMFSRLFPHSRQIHFRTLDNLATCSYGIYHNKIFFGLLPKPIVIDDENPQTIKLKDCQYNGSWVTINFYTPESIDNFIKKLEEVKLNIQLLEAAQLLDHGAEIVWTKKEDLLNEYKLGEYTTQMYEVSFQYPKK